MQVKIGRFNVVTTPAHDEHGPLVSFYDARADRSVPLFAERGQFVSRYYISTLTDDRAALEESGLCLDGGHRDIWSLTGGEMKMVFAWLGAAMSPPKTKRQIDTTIRHLRKGRYYSGEGQGKRLVKEDRLFPAEKTVLHQFLIEVQGPSGSVTSNEDGEVSSKAVTDWYVKQYCMLNHLKAA